MANDSLSIEGSAGSPVIRVVAGLIYRDGKLLVCQRRKDAAFPLKWEFPGGKVEVGESHEEALRRELREELNIEAGRIALVHQSGHRYSAGPAVSLSFYHVLEFAGSVENAVFEEILWIAPAELGRMDFLEGDYPLIQKILLEGEEFLYGV